MPKFQIKKISDGLPENKLLNKPNHLIERKSHSHTKRKKLHCSNHTFFKNLSFYELTQLINITKNDLAQTTTPTFQLTASLRLANLILNNRCSSRDGLDTRSVLRLIQHFNQKRKPEFTELLHKIVITMEQVSKDPEMSFKEKKLIIHDSAILIRSTIKVFIDQLNSDNTVVQKMSALSLDQTSPTPAGPTRS